MKLALAQLEVEAAAVSANRRRAVEAVERAAAEGCDLVVLPELFTVGYFAFDAYQRTAEGLDGETLAELRAVAHDHDIAILAGSLVEDLEASTAAGHAVPAEEGLANMSVFLDRDGERRAVYRKHHLFGYDSAESELLVPGEALPTVDFAGFTVGVTTCYDLRFPELYRRLVEAGATLVLVPSAWPYPRVEHWRLFPRARAVENQFYVAAANGVGRFEEAELLGRSTIYDPWGTTLASADDDPALVTATVTPEKVDAVREEFPALADRR
ncbi:carbon-nitrogen family hydrolase [Haloarcula onubensis]|uniref:Carbon-nitrogen family hydrolase n=1 Tax=Haloarcula onubensis TaxID=2950539 RepID=A0ABU2FQW4_9EURY|nr:carbon-nitrogen family hydrolase [Halomicroarcula sp. S3CR25-11]MDS0283154.1 carbon-nitrogen family hydrolase [Halomicroarcula sp. S3CR25-11]